MEECNVYSNKIDCNQIVLWGHEFTSNLIKTTEKNINTHFLRWCHESHDLTLYTHGNNSCLHMNEAHMPGRTFTPFRGLFLKRASLKAWNLNGKGNDSKTTFIRIYFRNLTSEDMILHFEDQSVSIIFMYKGQTKYKYIVMPSSTVNIVIKSGVRKCTFPPNAVYKSRQMEVDLCKSPFWQHYFYWRGWTRIHLTPFVLTD